jgi:hypothetical protein
MRRIGWIIGPVVVIVLGVSIGLLWRHYQIQPLQSHEERAKPVYEAHNPRCPDANELGQRPVVLEALNSAGNQHSVVLGLSEELLVSELEARLKPIFATRPARIAYVVDAAAAKPPYQSALVNRLLSFEFIEQVCVVDPRNPPKWYPPVLEYPRVSQR